MPSHHAIYQHHADRYELLISRQPDVIAVIESIIAIAGLEVVEL